MKSIFTSVFLLIAFKIFSQPVIELEEFATAIPYGPLGLINCGDDRIFIICQDGYILISDSLGNLNPVPFLNIDAEVESDFNAHGLLGAVFHPDYATNGFFYVNYINNDMNSVIARFSVSDLDPDQADPLSEQIMLTVDQPYTVHKAGDLHFGPDGYLYFPFGDGGVATPGGPGDPDNRAQNPTTYLGKMLRIDVNGDMPYEIPATNPFFGAVDTLNEIWAIGLRNPWRFSFDRLTGDMWLSDVGHDLWEEINFEPAGSTGGNNYGWRCYEANAEYNFDSCDATADYTFPIHDYPHDDSTGGYSVTGGYVYRGDDYPGLYGKYIYCDYINGNFYTLEPDGLGGWTNTIYDHLLYAVVSFGEDYQGEIYAVVRSEGIVYKVKDKCASLAANAVIQNEICGTEPDTGSIELFTTGGTPPYQYSWSTGDTTSFIDSLNAGEYTVEISDSNGCVISNYYEVFYDGVFDVTISDVDLMLVTDPNDPDNYTYQWYINGEIADGETLPTIGLTIEGTYTVAVTDTNGCTVMSNVFYFKDPIETSAVDNVNIFPNPATDFIYLENISPEINSVQILNATGQIVYSNQAAVDKINVVELSVGIYLLRIGDGEKYRIVQFQVAR